MLGRSAGFSFRGRALAPLLLCAALPLAGADSAIIKPPDGGWLPGTSVQIIAKGESGKLQLDGEALAVEQPFPGIFYAVAELGAGSHRLRFESASGVSEITFHSGVEPASGAGQPYTDHPPARIACTHCHSLSRRGRFRFSGGCQSCHAKEPFIRTHSHEPHELASCGMCHDAHGSAAAQLLLLPKEQACKQCHN